MVFPHSYRTEHSETKTSNSMYGEYYALELSRKIKIQPDLLKILQYVDSNRPEFVKDLSEMVAIPAVSGDLEHREDVSRMIKLVEKWLVKLGVKYECFDIGYHTVEGERVKLPLVILGRMGNDPSKKTVCVYGHLDSLLPDASKWNSDPWTLTEIEKKLYGCGVASGKGPILCWLHVLAAFVNLRVPLPVNIKLVIESMHCCRSEGLHDFLLSKKLDFLNDIDYVVVCDSEWLGDKYPCLVYGVVGKLRMEITVEKVKNSKSEPADDMLRIINSIVNDQEDILVPEYSRFVARITPDEEKLYENIQDFDPTEIRAKLPKWKQTWPKEKLLMHYWRFPAILTGDIEKNIAEDRDTNEAKCIITMKLVPHQTPNGISAIVSEHIKSLCQCKGVENKVKCEVISTTRPWLEDPRSHNFEAARRATIQIYKEDPNMIRDDTDYVEINILQKIIKKPILLLPLANKSSNAGKPNENIFLKNYYEGTKLLAAYLLQLPNTFKGDVK